MQTEQTCLKKWNFLRSFAKLCHDRKLSTLDFVSIVLRFYKESTRQIWLTGEEIMVRPAVPGRLYLLHYYEMQQAKQQKDRSERGNLQSCEKYVSY